MKQTPDMSLWFILFGVRRTLCKFEFSLNCALKEHCCGRLTVSQQKSYYLRSRRLSSPVVHLHCFPIMYRLTVNVTSTMHEGFWTSPFLCSANKALELSEDKNQWWSNLHSQGHRARIDTILPLLEKTVLMKQQFCKPQTVNHVCGSV